MACLLYTLMILFVAGSLCGGIPIKPKSPEEGATDDCYGTECYYYDTDYTDTNVQVTFPENLTDALLLALPNIQGSQHKIVMFLNKTLSSQDREAKMLERSLENIVGSQDEMITFLNKTLSSQDREAKMLERSLENIEGSQDEMITFLNKTLSSQDREAKMLERSLENIEGSQDEMITFMNKTLISQDKTLISQDKVAALLELLLQNLEESVENIDTGIQSIGQQIKNMTATMTDLMGNIANLLQNQLDVQRIGSPPPVHDCHDIAVRGIKKSGPYVITPTDGLGSFEVYCDLEIYNEGWTVFQNRFDGSVDFNLNWTQYEEGFGDANGEHWLGLKNIHRLISEGTWALKIDLESFDGETSYAVYDSFEISDAASNYRLSVGEYSGNAGDSLKMTIYSGRKMHNGMAFSTHDRDNDRGSDDCAGYYKAGWWYNACLRANLNGDLGPDRNDWTGMVWYTWKEQQSLKSSQMKIRRVQ